MLNYYNSIENLPIYNFNKIGETGDLKYLLKNESAKVSIDILEETYSKILTEYLDATAKFGNNSQLYNAHNQIIAFKLRFDVIMLNCFNLNLNYNEKSIEALQWAGYTISKDRSIAEQVHEIAHKAQNLKTKWMQKEQEIKKLEERDSGISFDQYVWRLSDKKGYKLNTKEITVSEWLAMEANMIIDEQQKKA